MKRLAEKRYRAWALGLMVLYVVLVFVLLPPARHAENVAARAALALAMVSPVIGVIWLMLWRVMSSDELQQRLHLMALSAATGIVATVSLLAGFLQTVHVIAVDGDILIWVFPALCMAYGLSRLALVRHFGGSGCES
ncbi:MAG: hypothetical protein JSS03_09685 [Proteobacteria bacterium]|nr:hypothetical protein [Pseudomonadota bacterium]